jgi:hypothetical protein
MCGRIRAEGQVKTISALALLAVALTLAMSGTAGATTLDYTFSGNNEGWLQAQDPAVGPFPAAGFQASGGNPGGRLSAKDTGPETGCPTGTDPCQLLTFYSPSVERLGANYGGTASFDLRSSVTPAFGAELLVLPASGDNYLDGLIPESLSPGWHHLSIELNETANWAVCPFQGGSCGAPSESDFRSLIADSDEIAVIADVGPLGTNETYDLDNVAVTEGGPQPPPGPPNGGPPPSKKPKKCKKKHKRAAAAKKCKKKRRAAASGLRG